MKPRINQREKKLKILKNYISVCENSLKFAAFSQFPSAVHQQRNIGINFDQNDNVGVFHMKINFCSCQLLQITSFSPLSEQIDPLPTTDRIENEYKRLIQKK